MALQHGPRLGAPSTSGFKVWAHFGGAATIKLEVRETGSTAWILQDTQAVDTAQSNTVVLEATGLTANTSYDYRVLEDDVQVATYVTRTMPASGRFDIFVLGDIHDQTAHRDAALTWIENNYNPATPSIICQWGDFHQDSYELVTTAAEYADVYLSLFTALEAASDIWAKIPFLYMHDDWDWRGNNSGIDRPSAGVTAAVALAGQLHLWRDRPRPASPSLGYSVEIAGVPILVLDQRSQKYYRSTEGFIPNRYGLQLYDLLGSVQHEWAKNYIRTHYTKGMFLLVSTTTWKDPIAVIGSPLQSGERDGLSIYYKNAQVDLATEMIRFGMGWRRNLVVMSGDDHANRIYSDAVHATRGPDELPVPGAALPLPFVELKVSLTGSLPVVKSNATFGQGNRMEAKEATPAHVPAITHWQITSKRGGENVTARITYHDLDLDEPFSNGDWWFENGTFIPYLTTNSTVNQYYPPGSGGKSGITYNRWYLDDVSGAYIPEDRATRDYYERLVDSNDVDRPDRDELTDGWDLPVEDWPEEP